MMSSLPSRFRPGPRAATVLALSLCCALVACERAAPPAPAAVPDAPAPATVPAATTPAGTPPAAAAPAMPPEAPPAQAPAASAARGVLQAFAGDAPGWDAFAGVAGVTWSDPEPVASPGALGFEDARSRSGKIAWVDTDPPPGGLPPKTEAGVTLIGRDAVEMAAFRKSAPSNDYEASIRAQLGADVQVTRIADRCARMPGTSRPDRRDTAFFEVRLGTGAPLYMEGKADKDGGNTGPGSTTYEFTRTRPDARIHEMGCVAS
jgi:hypothetical protein